MMYFKNILFFYIILNILACGNTINKPIGSPSDYQKYLSFSDTLQISKAQRKLRFWSDKYAESPNQYVYLDKLAQIHESLFELNGKIEHLKKAEKYFEKSIQISDSSDTGVLQHLARNYISQHKFKECLPLLKKAHSIGYQTLITNQILFDVYLELGNTTKARNYLEKIKNPKDFNYLIRKAKWEDHQGDLDNAITFLKLATTIAEKEENSYLKIWSYSNLGDFYGHHGDIQKAYNYYLKTLLLDPNNTYALKGIAWIQYAQNNNIIEANKILDAIIKYKKSPDTYLFKAELAEFSNNTVFKKIYTNNFLQLVSKPEYGVMYNKYLVEILADQEAVKNKAIDIAIQEVENRPTAQSYDLLAWSYYQNGMNKKALDVIEEQVINYTFEPVALFHAATIYKANNMTENIVSLKKKLKKASFELGPLVSKKVKLL